MGNKINWNHTKKKVEEIIERYINYCLLIDTNSTSNISKDYLLEKIDFDSINDYVNIDAKEIEKRIIFINAFRVAFNKLTCDERKLIYWTYLDKEHNYDDRYIANELGFSLGYYYIKKKDTIIRFAYALGVEIY